MEYKVITTSELYHHGIKGQKWGVKNGPPYPLNASDKSASEKRLSSNKKTNKVSKLDNSIKGWDDLNEDTQNAIINLSALTLSVLTSKLLNKAVNKLASKKCDKDLKDLYNNRDIEKLENIPKLKTKMSTEENMKKVNPDYPGPGATTNCMLCTTAMAMREKGYDVQANKTPNNGFFTENIDKIWSSEGSFKKINTIRSKGIISTLEKEPDGSYGNLAVFWKLGGGHSVFWKKEGSEVVIYDGQSGEKIKNDKLLNMVVPNKTQYSRLNDAQPTDLLLGAIKKTKGE